MQITQRTTPNQSSRKGWKPDMIVCHITDGSYAGAVGWHCNEASGVSSHFVVSRQGEVTQIVPLNMMAWCNGTTTNGDYRDCKYSTLKTVRDRKTNANYYTVSIETEGYYSKTYGALTDVQLDTLVDLILHIRKEIKEMYGNDIPIDREHIVGHFEINPKTRSCCPGHAFPWDELIRKLKEKDKPVAPKPTEKKKIYRVQVGAFSVYENAVNYKKKLENDGYSAYIVEEDV